MRQCTGTRRDGSAGVTTQSMSPVRLFSIAAFMLVTSTAVAAGGDRLVIATWNIQELGDGIGSDRRVRGPDDYERLRRYADMLNADVIAIQEIENEAAAQRVFDPTRYEIVLEHAEGSSFNIRTGFALKRGLTFVHHPDYETIGLKDLRDGTDIAISIGSSSVRMLSVHLKAGCIQKSLGSADAACSKLSRQIEPLKEWIDARRSENTPFVILGDFNRRLGQGGDDFLMSLGDSLTPITGGKPQSCPGHAGKLHIDNMLLDRRAQELWDGKFDEIVFSPEDSAFLPGLSDHCPIRVALYFPTRIESGEETVSRTNTVPIKESLEMSFGETLQVVANVAAIFTAVVAVLASFYVLCSRWRRCRRLEKYLRNVKEAAQPGDRGQRSILHLMARLGMTEAEILQASFGSERIRRALATDDTTGRAAAILLEYESPKN